MKNSNSNYDGKIERKRVEIEKVVMTNLTLNKLLKDELVKELSKIGKKMNGEINPIAFILMSESNIDEKRRVEPIILSHMTKKNLKDERLNIEVQNKELIEQLISALKKV